MLAIFGNVALPELGLILVLAIIIFGKRLPDVAGRFFVNLRRMRWKLEELRRESGIDEELRRIERTMREATTFEPPPSGPPANVPPIQPLGRPPIVPPPGGPKFPERPPELAEAQEPEKADSTPEVGGSGEGSGAGKRDATGEVVADDSEPEAKERD